MRIIKSKYIGFCDGVEGSVRLVKRLNKNCCMLGNIINNARVVESLIQEGAELVSIDNLEFADPMKKIVIRAHGITKEAKEKLKSLGIKYYDSTCPEIKKIHIIIKKNFDNGKEIIIVGDKEHPEVIAENSICNYQGHVMGSIGECMKTIENIKNKECILVVQSTSSFDLADEIIKICRENIKKLKIYNTICNQTYNRQKEILDLAVQNINAIIIVGDRNSSNTRKLYTIAKKKWKEVLLIESADEINPNMFTCGENVFITGGASTPHRFIEEVERKLLEG